MRRPSLRMQAGGRGGRGAWVVGVHKRNACMRAFGVAQLPHSPCGAAPPPPPPSPHPHVGVAHFHGADDAQRQPQHRQLLVPLGPCLRSSRGGSTVGKDGGGGRRHPHSSIHACMRARCRLSRGPQRTVRLGDALYTSTSGETCSAYIPARASASARIRSHARIVQQEKSDGRAAPASSANVRSSWSKGNSTAAAIGPKPRRWHWRALPVTLGFVAGGAQSASQGSTALKQRSILACLAVHRIGTGGALTFVTAHFVTVRTFVGGWRPLMDQLTCSCPPAWLCVNATALATTAQRPATRPNSAQTAHRLTAPQQQLRHAATQATCQHGLS
jgi:hypothetical protein